MYHLWQTLLCKAYSELTLPGSIKKLSYKTSINLQTLTHFCSSGHKSSQSVLESKPNYTQSTLLHINNNNNKVI